MRSRHTATACASGLVASPVHTLPLTKIVSAATAGSAAGARRSTRGSMRVPTRGSATDQDRRRNGHKKAQKAQKKTQDKKELSLVLLCLVFSFVPFVLFCGHSLLAFSLTLYPARRTACGSCGSRARWR